MQRDYFSRLHTEYLKLKAKPRTNKTINAMLELREDMRTVYHEIFDLQYPKENES